jgi:hypothetical protein
MSTQVQFRRGTTVEHSGFTGAIGEVTVDTVKQTCVVHDATQPGGYPLLREDCTNAALSPGSLTSCALKFAGDPDTGIISPGINQIALVTGGVARLTIDGSGAVTIPNNLIVSGNFTVNGSFSSTDELALIVALG